MTASLLHVNYLYVCQMKLSRHTVDSSGLTSLLNVPSHIEQSAILYFKFFFSVLQVWKYGDGVALPTTFKTQKGVVLRMTIFQIYKCVCVCVCKTNESFKASMIGRKQKTSNDFLFEVCFSWQINSLFVRET